MASFNKIVIVGYLGRDPEIRYTPDGTAVCNFSIATSEKKKDRGGDMQEQTTWFRVTVWRNQAEAVHKYLTKGRQVYVEGRLRQEEFTDRDGNKRMALEVTATDVQFLGSPRDEGGGAPSSRPGGGQSSPSRYDAPEPDDARDEDIPF
jgi:single-strand DNA-binding protein